MTSKLASASPPHVDPSLDSHYTRKRFARMFAWIGLSVLLVYGASWWQRSYPHAVEIRYLYRDIPQVSMLHKVEAIVSDEETTKGRALFFHHTPVPTNQPNYFRRQRLQLAKGNYRIQLTLHFGKRIRRYQTRLLIQDAGIYFVYLKRAL